MNITTYTGEKVNIMGSIAVPSYNDQAKDLTLQVVQGNGLSLMGRDCLKNIILDWPSLQ